MTICGLIFPMLHFITLIYYDWTFDSILPHWWFLHGTFAIFWYQTIDAVDGKQARKTDNCSPLDLDQISYTIIFLSVCTLCRTGHDFWTIVMLMPAVFTPHYSIEYRKHFTKIHVTVVGLFGATESMLIMMTGFMGCYFHSEANQVEFLGFQMNVVKIILYGSFISGLHYNLTNIYFGFNGAPTTERAIQAIYPYVQLYFMAYLQQYSQFYTKMPMIFYAGLGIYQTYVAGLLNISSTAEIPFQYHYWEAYTYIVLILIDFNRLLPAQFLVGGYIFLVIVISIKYGLFLYSIITQLTSYLGIKLLKVKQTSKKVK
ncbi:UNKNOWN [Stylonychia lemnae]|uniref:Uncharacterized protein n=1 Tax=Stylonychia lemnae TaxID=5949 RepID=A0A078A6T8_STYLE|nr:UNKNOWN [Stylonychia lemnae]|eukprot:CDW77934.1 UNKNOWN [Stylonychia lemnae]